MDADAQDAQSRTGERRSTSLYTPPTVMRLLDAVADGLNLSQACIAAGIGRRTMYDWQKKYPRLLKRLEEAREQARQKALATIKRFGETDYKAAAEFFASEFSSRLHARKHRGRSCYERRRCRRGLRF